ncbi:hypothetical protein F4775DRAFT_474312 [Biscogniauxia sp. FL1348]|nr:hypothetical protein F4775DRAFT_474312 [Biscogniauxia sp. FL1348]
MPLHLLGKKSWNVYNKENIARVRRDEAAAREREEAEEKKRQEIDAARRLAILRGEDVPPLPPQPPSPSSPQNSTTRLAGDDQQRQDGQSSRDWTSSQRRKKRKRHGEDDTDFEMRLARERAEEERADATTTTTSLTKRKAGGNSSSMDAPLIDSAGHIDLFPAERAPEPNAKNQEAEREAAQRRRAFEDQYTMRFANAAGTKAGESLRGPWYAKGGEMAEGNAEAPGRDVWGNEDPRRREREAARMASSDPLAMMKRGAAQVREVEKERRATNEERGRETRELRREERRREKKKKRRTRDGEDGDGERGRGVDRDSPDARGSGRKHLHRRRERADGHGHRHGHRPEGEDRHSPGQEKDDRRNRH